MKWQLKESLSLLSLAFCLFPAMENSILENGVFHSEFHFIFGFFTEAVTIRISIRYACLAI